MPFPEKKERISFCVLLEVESRTVIPATPIPPVAVAEGDFQYLHTSIPLHPEPDRSGRLGIREILEKHAEDGGEPEKEKALPFRRIR